MSLRPNLPFPDLAQRVADRPDGRFKLLRIIQDRFDYISKFSELKQNSTKFYRAISTMPYINVFITTNWDRNFEEIWHAKPFIYDADMRFWEIPRRKVLKIHGTIDDYSSIVATREDYTERENSLHKSLIGSKLKEILTTKTCIFVGYSLKDDDFREIFSFVRSSQGKFEKTHYFVSPTANQFNSFKNIIPIKTDGTFFFNVLKEHMCNNHCYLPDNIFDLIADELDEVIDIHHEFWKTFNAKKFPQILLSAVYQDGLIHGYRLFIDSLGSGQFSDLHIVQAKISAYNDRVKEYRRKRKYLDVAYFTGFKNALITLATSKFEDEFIPAPLFYFEKMGEMYEDEFKRNLLKLPKIHKSAFLQCKKAVSNWPDEGDFVIQHPPWG